MMQAPVIWTLTDGKAGIDAQAEGLAQQVAEISGATIIPGRVKSGAVSKCLPRLGAALGLYQLRIDETVSPSMLIGCGAQAQAALIALKKKYRAFAVYIQRPVGGIRGYDAVVAPRHDYAADETAAQNAKIILTLGSVNKINSAQLAELRDEAMRLFARYPPPYIGVLLGGDNRMYTVEKDALVGQLQRLAVQSNATLLITPSRRSAKPLVEHLQAVFGARHFVWRGEGDNPYMAILAVAEGFCVTADSVNMLSEASMSGRAVYILPLQKKGGMRARRARKKFTAFYEALIERGNARWFNNEWQRFEAEALDETRRAAEQVWELYQQTQGQAHAH